MEDAKDDPGGLVWTQAEQRPAQGDAGSVRELGSQLADRYAFAAEQVREYERQLAHMAGTRPHPRPRQPGAAA
ncbi:hypothetical protein ACFWFI_23975 [Streptomyces sp. NPDC060209]|uniref:hypothetical protein n=1 Tax=Streptomyces sp. NPDC060209 TaxID=3347073 RepID=UPI003654DA2F